MRRRDPVDGPEPGIDRAPSASVLGKRQALSGIEAESQRLRHRVHCVRGGSPPIRCACQRSREGGHGCSHVEAGSECTLCRPESAQARADVGESEGTTEDVGEVLGRHELIDRCRVLPFSQLEIPVRPPGETDEGRCSATSETVIVGAQAGGPFTVGDSSAEIGAQQGKACPVHRNLPWQAGVLLIVVHDHVADPTIGVEPSLDVVEDAASTPSTSPVTIRAPTRAMFRTDRLEETDSGMASSHSRWFRS